MNIGERFFDTFNTYFCRKIVHMFLGGAGFFLPNNTKKYLIVRSLLYTTNRTITTIPAFYNTNHYVFFIISFVCCKKYATAVIDTEKSIDEAVCSTEGEKKKPSRRTTTEKNISTIESDAKVQAFHDYIDGEATRIMAEAENRRKFESSVVTKQALLDDSRFKHKTDCMLDVFNNDSSEARTIFISNCSKAAHSFRAKLNARYDVLNNGLKRLAGSYEKP